MSRPETITTMRRRTPDGRQREPRPGSHLRAVWDLLFANAGRWVPTDDISAAYGRSVTASRGASQFIEHLKNDYGLDIRCGWGKWLLAGEHDGLAYLDYVADPDLAKRFPKAV